jgi:hypothetical protein
MRYSFSHRIRFVVHQFFAIEMPVSCSCLVHCHDRIWSYRGPLQLNRALVDQCLMYLSFFRLIIVGYVIDLRMIRNLAAAVFPV